MNDTKLFAKNEKELATQAVRIYNQCIGMEFGIEKCAMLIIKSGKQQMTEGMELLNQEKIRTPGEEKSYEYLRILEANIIKQVDKIKKKKKTFSRKRVNYLKTNFI